MCEKSEIFNKFPVEAMRFIWEKLDYDDARNLAETCSKLRKSYFQNENYVQDPAFVIRLLWQKNFTAPFSSTIQRFVRNGKLKSKKYPDIKFTHLHEASNHLENWRLKSIFIKSSTLDESLADMIERHGAEVSVDVITEMFPTVHFHFREAENLLENVYLRLEKFIFPIPVPYDDLETLFSKFEGKKNLDSLELNIYFEDSDFNTIPNEKKIEMCQSKLGCLSKYLSFSLSENNVIITADDLKKCRDYDIVFQRPGGGGVARRGVAPLRTKTYRRRGVAPLRKKIYRRRGVAPLRKKIYRRRGGAPVRRC